MDDATGATRIHKVASTPDEPSRAILWRDCARWRSRMCLGYAARTSRTPFSL